MTYYLDGGYSLPSLLYPASLKAYMIYIQAN